MGFGGGGKGSRRTGPFLLVKDEDLENLTFPQFEARLGAPQSLLSLDLSRQQLERGGANLAELLLQLDAPLRALYLHHNCFGDDTAYGLAHYVKRSSSTLRELHLSHNRITAQGAQALVLAAATARGPGDDPKYPYLEASGGQPVPFWLRLECNQVEPRELASDVPLESLCKMERVQRGWRPRAGRLFCRDDTCKAKFCRAFGRGGGVLSGPFVHLQWLRLPDHGGGEDRFDRSRGEDRRGLPCRFERSRGEDRQGSPWGSDRSRGEDGQGPQRRSAPWSSSATASAPARAARPALALPAPAVEAPTVAVKAELQACRAAPTPVAKSEPPAGPCRAAPASAAGPQSPVPRQQVAPKAELVETEQSTKAEPSEKALSHAEALQLRRRCLPLRRQATARPRASRSRSRAAPKAMPKKKKQKPGNNWQRDAVQSLKGYMQALQGKLAEQVKTTEEKEAELAKAERALRRSLAEQEELRREIQKLRLDCRC